MIYDLVKEIKDDQKEITVKLQEQSECLIRMENDVRRNADDLKEHMRRTELLEKLHEKNATKISEVEKKVEEIQEPTKIKKLLISKVLKTAGLITAVSGAVLAVLKVISMTK